MLHTKSNANSTKTTSFWECLNSIKVTVSVSYIFFLYSGNYFLLRIVIIKKRSLLPGATNVCVLLAILNCFTRHWSNLSCTSLIVQFPMTCVTDRHHALLTNETMPFQFVELVKINKANTDRPTTTAATFTIVHVLLFSASFHVYIIIIVHDLKIVAVQL